MLLLNVTLLSLILLCTSKLSLSLCRLACRQHRTSDHFNKHSQIQHRISLSLSLSLMASRKSGTARKHVHKGAWTAEEDKKLTEYIEKHGAKKWKIVALKSGLNRCGKSCRLRWLNYLRPNIKRGNIAEDEADLILRLHKLLGNRWSLIAGRLPGRTDNEIKNYWNSHLSKKVSQVGKSSSSSAPEVQLPKKGAANAEEVGGNKESEDPELNFDVDEFFDFSVLEHECDENNSVDI